LVVWAATASVAVAAEDGLDAPGPVVVTSAIAWAESPSVNSQLGSD
jgi:hypothetical protein